MASKQPGKQAPRFSSRSLLRWGAALVLAVGLSWLISWMVQRSYSSSNTKRAMQLWLDDFLNADVSLAGSMTVRVNLARDSRLVLNRVEVEHPNPLFGSKFLQFNSIGAWAPPWSVLKVWPGDLDVQVNGMRMVFEESDSGEWSSAGLMKPLVSGDTPFPFPIPRVSGWSADLNDSSVAVRRRGDVFKLQLNGELTGRAGSGVAALRTGALPFTFGPAGAEAERAQTGKIGPVVLTARIGKDTGWRPEFVPGRCRMQVEDVPARMLPFLAPGIPLESVPGMFNGTAQYRETPDAAGTLVLEGELRDVPLAVFGLPRQAPVQVNWPIRPNKNGLAAEIRMGPSGYGAFAINIPLDAGGRPKQLAMRGDVASLDDMPELFTSHSRWPEWLSRTFPSIEWRAGRWLGFGWSGKDMQLSLTRTMAGMNLTGEGELMNGRVRLSMTPGQPDTPVTVAAEKVDAQLLAVKLSQLLPEPFKVQLSGAHANLTWRGLSSDDNRIEEWSSGMVFAKPTIDLAASGPWWRGMSRIVQTAIKALPDWGGGDAAGLEKLAGESTAALDQISIVVEKHRDGGVAVEFRAYSERMGQATGLIERYPDGAAQGEFYLSGDSEILKAIRAANPAFGQALTLIATETVGLRVMFTLRPGAGLVFSYPFLDDAKKVRDAMRQGVEAGETPSK